ncbi:MAG: sulfatase-like hydrolase/transferase [Niabella sp.]
MNNLPTRLATILLLCACSILGTAQKKTNIILIMADDLGYETLGCNGNDDQMTPRLDALAQTGMRFTNCYATPLCTPSRVQLMTGKYNNRNYIGFGLLDPKETTFGTLLKNQGYKTCIAGKWQLLGNAQQRKLAGGKTGALPQNTGFDKYCLWQVDSVGSRYADPLIYENGQSTIRKGQYGPDVFTNYIENFIEENANRPFFVYYPMCLTHDPFCPTPFTPQNAQYENKDSGYFKDMVRYTDYLVGRIINKVNQSGIKDNTLIIFIGDNGTDVKITSNFNGGTTKGDKGATTERGTHVPMIVHWNGIEKKGSVNDGLIDFTDFLPTLMDISQHKENSTTKTDGFSFYPQLVNKKAAERKWVFCYYNPNWGNFTPRTYAQDKEWKVYETGEIYNLQKDPSEVSHLNSHQLSKQQKRKITKLKNVIKDKLQNQ